VEDEDQTRPQGEPALTWTIEWVARHLPGALYRCAADPELTMLALTERFEALTGHTARALIGNAECSYASLIHADDRASVLEELQRVCDHDGYVELEFRLRHASGDELWIRQQAWPVHPSKQAGGACLEGFIFDVTEQSRLRHRHAERQRAHARQQRCLLELATHPTLAEGRFEALSRLATERVAELVEVERASVWLLDARAENIELIDLCARSSGGHERGFTLSARQYPRYFEALRSGRSIDADDAAQDPRTREFAETYLRPLDIGAMLDAAIRVAGKVVGIVCLEHVGPPRRWNKHEIDFAGEVADQLSLALLNKARLEAQAVQDELRAQLYQSQKMDALGRLAGGVAHDFNNVLMAIGSNAELLLTKLQDPELRQSAAEIVDTSFRASELVAQLLRFARREPLELRNVELRELVRKLELLLGRLLGKSLRFEVRLPSEPVYVRATEVMIQQILTNLVLNARDAIDESGRIIVQLDTVESLEAAGVLAAAELSAGDSAARPYARLRVIDDGMGMNPEVQSKLFEPFFTTKRPGDGTGLGLATVYSIVQCCGGIVDVDSELGRGTTVTVLLPSSAR
jgi:PAS domain S-box-containing protein